MAVHEAATMELHFGQRAHRLPTTKEVANHFTEGIDCETVIDRSGLEFPLEQCHYGAGIEFTITSTPKDLYFVGQGRFAVGAAGVAQRRQEEHRRAEPQRRHSQVQDAGLLESPK